MPPPSSLPWLCGCSADSVAAAASIAVPRTNSHAASAAAAASSSSAGLASAARQIRQARDVFVAKEAVLQKKISQEMERAKEFTKSGNKQAAMQCLKRKKYYESQMSQTLLGSKRTSMTSIS
ncbi:charged multivesicular body protein 4b-like isoform X2 [Panicum virgatum]|uniref:charged multivesicular body protein 4b-like isoform X2 n=1 Tax=Panicum virgatum TaxID=38727 RepID=UPI0019D5CB86|nr:charged multivesicular body protein 4b-like isoform X2 [Panicum virgatum]